MDLSAAGAAFLFLTTLYVPFASIRGARRMAKPGGTPTRAQLLVSVFLTQAMGLGIALLVARWERIELFPPPSIGWKNVALALGFLVPTLATIPWRWSWRSTEDKRRMMWMLPNRPSDLSWWLFVSLAAGIGEEIVYRGVMATLWERVLGAWWPAILVCSIAFGAAHWVQGVRAVAVIVVFAIGDHLIVRATGDLYTAMTIHFVYDLLAGVIFMRLAKRDGVTVAPAASNAGAVGPLVK